METNKTPFEFDKILIMIRKIISRKKAKSLGRILYYTGRPCIKGHLNFRRVENGKCCKCIQQSYERSKPYLQNPKTQERMRIKFKKWSTENIERWHEIQAKNRAKRKETQFYGQKFNGNICPLCNGTERYSSSGQCTRCQKKIRVQNAE